MIFWSDATYQLFQIKLGPSLVLLGGKVQYCSGEDNVNDQDGRMDDDQHEYHKDEDEGRNM